MVEWVRTGSQTQRLTPNPDPNTNHNIIPNPNGKLRDIDVPKVDQPEQWIFCKLTIKSLQKVRHSRSRPNGRILSLKAIVESVTQKATMFKKVSAYIYCMYLYWTPREGIAQSTALFHALFFVVS